MNGKLILLGIQFKEIYLTFDIYVQMLCKYRFQSYLNVLKIEQLVSPFLTFNLV